MPPKKMEEDKFRAVWFSFPYLSPRSPLTGRGDREFLYPVWHAEGRIASIKTELVTSPAVEWEREGKVRCQALPAIWL